MDLAKLRTDKSKINEGIWVEVLPDIEVKMISTSSVEFKKYAMEQMKPYQAIGTEPSFEESNRLGARAFSHCAIKDWRSKDAEGNVHPHITLDGEQIKFSPEVALKVFLEIEEFLTAVVRAAGNLSNFRKAALDNTSGN